MPNLQPCTHISSLYLKAGLFSFHTCAACNNAFDINEGVLRGAANYMVIVLLFFGVFVKKISIYKILIWGRTD